MGKPDLGRLIAQTMAQPAGGRTIEAITGDILEAKRTGGEAILTIGRCLIEAKDLLPHGEWLPWLTERVEFSPRTAQNFMRLAREWTNTQTLADLGASKALSLLALPPEEREQFMEENNVIDMSARQLEAAIKERDEARIDAADAQKSAMKLREALAAMQQERQVADQEVQKLTEELDELKARPVEVAVETVVDQEAIDKARDEARAEMQAKLDKAREAAAKARDRQKQAEASVEILKRSLEEREKAEKKAELSADKDLAQFEVLFQQAQETANKMRGFLIKFRERKDPTAAQGAEKALKALAEAIGRCVE